MSDDITLIHIPDRPSWKCRTCHDDWPCRVKKVLLINEFLTMPTNLYVMMALYMTEATQDLPLPQGELYERFMAWPSREGLRTSVQPWPRRQPRQRSSD